MLIYSGPSNIMLNDLHDLIRNNICCVGPVIIMLNDLHDFIRNNLCCVQVVV